MVILVALLSTGMLAYAIHMSTQRRVADPKTYLPLLSLIANVESNDNYNAHFGNSRNQTTKFTDMTIAEVLEWQKVFVEKGSPSSAVGRYQIINTTLSGLVRELQLPPDQKFDEKTQDRMAIALLERRGAENYVNDEISKEEFAANLAKEWAALPKVTGPNPENSFYAGDGLNKARISTNEVLQSIDLITAQ